MLVSGIYANIDTLAIWSWLDEQSSLLQQAKEAWKDCDNVLLSLYGREEALNKLGTYLHELDQEWRTEGACSTKDEEE